MWHRVKGPASHSSMALSSLQHLLSAQTHGCFSLKGPLPRVSTCITPANSFPKYPHWAVVRKHPWTPVPRVYPGALLPSVQRVSLPPCLPPERLCWKEEDSQLLQLHWQLVITVPVCFLRPKNPAAVILFHHERYC